MILKPERYEGSHFNSKTEFPPELVGADFFDCEFVGCRISERRLSRCRFIDCSMTDIDASLTTMVDCTVRGVSFKGCKLLGINWTLLRALEASSWEDCLLDDCCFQALPLRGTNFQQCRARMVDFSDCNLCGATFSATNLRGANFIGADLRNAQFDRAVDVDIDASTVKLHKTRLEIDAVVRLAHRMGIEVVNMT